MKVFDILTESEQTNEGPIRFLKRTLGKNTAMGKRAQLDVDIEREAKSILGDFYAIAKNSPSGKMTVKGLADFLTQKGFVNKPSQVVAYMQQSPSLGRRLAKAGASVKKAMSPEKSKLAPKDGSETPEPEVKQQPVKTKTTTTKKKTVSKKKTDKLPSTVDNTDKFGNESIEQMYAEAMIMQEADIEISKADALGAIKKFVQQGMAAGVKSGKTQIKKSAFGDAPTQTKKQPQKSDGEKPQMLDKALVNAISKMKDAGYTVIDPDGNKL